MDQGNMNMRFTRVSSLTIRKRILKVHGLRLQLLELPQLLIDTGLVFDNESANK